MAVPRGNGDGGEGKLARAEADGAHVVVGAEELATQMRQQPLDGRAVPGERLAQDDVLHAVGGDNARVVALSIGAEEGVAEDLEVHLYADEDVAASGEGGFGDGGDAAERARVDAVQRHTQLAIADLVGVVRVHGDLFRVDDMEASRRRCGGDSVARLVAMGPIGAW
jgi:hypothetical protein